MSEISKNKWKRVNALYDFTQFVIVVIVCLHS